MISDPDPSYSVFGSSIGRNGLGAVGENITSLGTDLDLLKLGGTSAAAPFVTGAIALLMSIFPKATTTEVKLSITQNQKYTRKIVVPPLMDAWAAYQYLGAVYGTR